MTEEKAYRENRALPCRFETATVYSREGDAPYGELLAQLAEPISAIRNIVAVVQNVSAKGIGITIEGQQFISKSLLRDGQPCILKLVVGSDPIPASARPFVRRDGTSSFVLVKAVCRWLKSSSGLSSAGFEILESNPAEVVELFRRLGPP